MKLALLGADPESCFLVQGAVELGHELVWVGDLAGMADSLPAGTPSTDQADEWEALSDAHVCDAVIVGRGETSPAVRAEQLIQLAKQGRPLLTTFPIVDSVLSYYEIDMARNESRAVLCHFNPLVSHEAAIAQAATWVRDGHPQLGRIEQVVWDRPLRNRSREQVLWHFARDVELIDRIAGPLNKLGALGSPQEEATYSGLNVQMLGSTTVPARWTVGPVEDSENPTLALVGQHGKLVCSFSRDGTPQEWNTTGSNLNEANSASQVIEKHDPGTGVLESFLTAVATSDMQVSTWPGALKAMELTDTIEISLRRGRMIDVHLQQLTEELSFKGTMSALGCGVLLLLPPVLLLMGWLAEKVGLPIADYWPHALLALLAAFLAFQLIPKVLLKRPNQTKEQQDSNQESASKAKQ